MSTPDHRSLNAVAGKRPAPPDPGRTQPGPRWCDYAYAICSTLLVVGLLVYAVLA